MIQGVINRLAQCSFVVKGWSVTLTAALLALASNDNDRAFAWIAAGAVSVFALLDALYLAHERGFRRLYENAVKGAAQPWAMKPEKQNTSGVVGSLFSWSVAMPHGAALAASFGVALFG